MYRDGRKPGSKNKQPFSEATREKHRIRMQKPGSPAWKPGQVPWNKGVPHSEGTRSKIRAKMAVLYESKHGEVVRQKIRDARLRQKNVAFGVPGVPNDRVRRWWEELRKDPVRYDAYMEKRRQSHITWNKGKSWGDETRAKMREAWKQRRLRGVSLETRQKLAATQRANIAARGHGYAKGNKQSAETVAKRMATFKRIGYEPKPTPLYGSDHPNWGKPAYKGTGIGKGSYCLKGHWVRSTWERTVADWFHSNNVPYEYEPQLFDLGDGVRYRPDFYLPKWKLWVEVKGYVTKVTEQKIKRFTATGHRLVVIGGEEMSELHDLLSLGH